MLYYAVLLVFILEYLRPEKYIPILKSTFYLPLGLLFFSVLSNKADKPQNSEILRMTNTKWLLFFLVLIVISAMTADVTLYVWRFFTVVIGYFILYFLITKEINDLSKLKHLFALLIFSHIAMAILSPNILLHPETRSYLTQGGTFLGDGNDFAWSVCIVLPFTIFLYLNVTSRVKKILSIVAFVTLTLCIIGTQSRGGTLALVAIILYQWIKSRKKVQGIVVVSLLVIVVLLFAPTAYFERINTIKDYENEKSAEGRIMAWKSAIRMAADHPFLGVGANHFPVKFGTDYRPPGVGRTEMAWLNTHSIYFKILGEFGFPGIIFLLYIILSNFLTTERSVAYFSDRGDMQSLTYRNLLICLNSSLIGFAVGGLFLSGLTYPHLFVVSGMFSASELILQKQIGLIAVPETTTSASA